MLSRRLLRLAVLAIAAATFALAFTACGDDDDDDGGGGGGDGGGGGRIALLLPESQTARYEAADRPLFEAKVEELCPDCEIEYSNAGQDASRQQQQADAALTQGVDVLVLDPVDAGSAGAIVQRAKQQDVPVLSYDRLITNADIDYYVSFDNEEVGRLQATSLVEELESRNRGNGTIVMINGDPADNNAALFKRGAHSVIDESNLRVGREYDTPGWLGENAQQSMEQAITALGNDAIDGVYAANDVTGGAAIAAMKSAGIDPQQVPVTGQDAELAGIQRILIGEQFITVYKSYKQEAEASAEIAAALAQGEEVPADLVTDQIDNGEERVPSVILTPIVVTTENIQDTVIADGLYEVSEVCRGRYASACEEAGIQ
jgi:D-xylose transport system substrate-binding protein